MKEEIWYMACNAMSCCKGWWPQTFLKKSNIENICVSLLSRFIFPILYIPQILQYDSSIRTEGKKTKTRNVSLKRIFLLMWQIWSNSLHSSSTPNPFLFLIFLFPSSSKKHFAVLLGCSACQLLATSGMFGCPQSIIWLQLAQGAPAVLLNVMDRGNKRGEG